MARKISSPMKLLSASTKSMQKILAIMVSFSLTDILQKVVVLEISENAIARCLPFFPEGQDADILHAATCLSTAGIGFRKCQIVILKDRTKKDARKY